MFLTVATWWSSDTRNQDGTVGNKGTPALALSGGDIATPGVDATRAERSLDRDV